MIHIAEVASQIPQCTWGIGHGFSAGDLGSEVRRLKFILAVDARTLAADGHYRAALARCLTIRRLARHVGDNTLFLYLVSRQTDRMAQQTIQHVLGVTQPDTDTLIWLRGQLVAVQGTSPSLAKTLQTDFESILHGMRTNAELLRKVRNLLVEKAEDERAKENARNLTDDELLDCARVSYAHFLNSVLRVIDSDISYERKYAEIQRLKNKLEEEYGSDPAAGHLILLCARQVIGCYGLQVRDTAYFNALKAAVEIYLVKAKNGQLPRILPEGLPKDPFTGRDFVYEITGEGFALRCQGKEFQKGRMRQMLEFKVQK